MKRIPYQHDHSQLTQHTGGKPGQLLVASLTFFIAANLHKAGGTSYMGKARALVSKAEDKVPKRKPETTPDVGSIQTSHEA